jgi:hypothetical protein
VPKDEDVRGADLLSSLGDPAEIPRIVLINEYRVPDVVRRAEIVPEEEL